MALLVLFSFVAGIFTALSPCILPVLPAILAAGASEGRLRPLGTILGLIISFAFFTLTLTWLVQETGISSLFLRYIAIALIFFFGLVMIFPALSNWFAAATAPVAGVGQSLQSRRSGFWGGFLFGIALGLIWTPCAGPILAAITTLVASHALSWTAVLMTLAYSLGAALPLFIIAYGSSQLIKNRLSRHTEGIRQFFGALMMLFALVLLFNWDMLLNQQLARLFPQILSESSLPVEKQLQQVISTENVAEGEKAPELAGIIAWVNTPPLKLSQLKGKVVLIDFWTYSCINCLRTLPYLKSWDSKYREKGLVIIGVHTPEFEFEKDLGNVKKAAISLGVDYPIALDNNYATWNAFQNHSWPAHFLIDQQGKIAMVHFGEGGYVETENDIRKLLGLGPLKMAEPPQNFMPISPETYLGLERGRSYKMEIIPLKTEDYAYEPPLADDQAGLRGPWLAEDEFIESRSDHSYLDFNFLATNVYLVLSGNSQEPIEVELDGKPYGQIRMNGDKKYDVVRTSYERHTLSLKIPEGIRAYAFTFGNDKDLS